MTNCPRCNAILKQNKISCPKCGKIYRMPVPERLLRRERFVDRIEESQAMEHHKRAARDALDQERFSLGL